MRRREKKALWISQQHSSLDAQMFAMMGHSIAGHLDAAAGPTSDRLKQLYIPEDAHSYVSAAAGNQGVVHELQRAAGLEPGKLRSTGQLAQVALQALGVGAGGGGFAPTGLLMQNQQMMQQIAALQQALAASQSQAQQAFAQGAEVGRQGALQQVQPTITALAAAEASARQQHAATAEQLQTAEAERAAAEQAQEAAEQVGALMVAKVAIRATENLKKVASARDVFRKAALYRKGRITELKAKMRKLSAASHAEFERLLRNSAPPAARHLKVLFESQMRCLKNKSLYCHWHEEILQWCGAIWRKDRGAYEQVWNGGMALLPHPGTGVRHWFIVADRWP